MKTVRPGIASLLTNDHPTSGREKIGKKGRKKERNKDRKDGWGYGYIKYNI